MGKRHLIIKDRKIKFDIVGDISNVPIEPDEYIFEVPFKG